MRHFMVLVLGLVLAAGFAGGAQAAAQKYILDKPHTQIIFSVDHLGFSHSYGKFDDYEGFISLDQDDPKNSSVDVTIQTASLDLADEKWDEHLKSKDFFNVEKFPTMTFKSTNVNVTGEQTADVTGDLTLLGVTKPVTLHVSLNKLGKHPFDNKLGVGFSARGKLKRSDFGMGYGIPMVGDDVDIIIETEAYQPDPTGQGVGNK